ncbi:CYP27A1 [Symbiodinium sp. CCMP2456]|nr:CYP27A1 [Symbiodinium sp. CCMP2456]
MAWLLRLLASACALQVGAVVVCPATMAAGETYFCYASATAGQAASRTSPRACFMASCSPRGTTGRIIAPAFNAKNVESYTPAITEIAEKFMSVLDADCRAEVETNFSELLPLYVGDVLCMTAFGEDLGMLQTRDGSLVKDIEKIMTGINSRVASWIPYWKFPFLGRLDEGARASARMAKRMVDLMEKQSGRGDTVVERLRKMGGDKFSHEELVNNLVVLFAAGTDAPAQTLTWVFYHIARLPELQRALAEEVKSVPQGVVSLEKLDSLKLVHATWLETLRMSSEATELPSTVEDGGLDELPMSSLAWGKLAGLGGASFHENPETSSIFFIGGGVTLSWWDRLKELSSGSSFTQGVEFVGVERLGRGLELRASGEVCESTCDLLHRTSKTASHTPLEDACKAFVPALPVTLLLYC